jgi:hypothetical protein
MPDCNSPVIISETVVGEICHIRARRKGGARYDPSLTSSQRDEFENLLLLCRTCHTLVDADPKAYSANWLQEIKRLHEQRTPTPVELSQNDARQALLILAKHTGKSMNTAANVNVLAHIGAQASATHRSVSVAIGGANHGPINISTTLPRTSRTPLPANSIGADANMTSYVEYLCDLYVKYMQPIEPNENISWAKIGKHIKTKFRLKKRTRSHLSADRFWDLVNYLIGEKLASTPVGKKHLHRGTKLCRTFDEYRRGEM